MFLVNVLVALIGLVAATALLPEFCAAERPALDLPGVAASVLGLVAVIYGLITAGEDGWGNPGALLLILAGIAILAGFLAWERRLTRSPGGHPLLDMTLFSSPSFTWGAIFAAMSFLSVIGVLFTMPQYFQGVLGTTAMGSGLRLLPLVGGVLIGAVPAAQAVGLDRGASDDDELDLVPEEDLQQLAATGVDRVPYVVTGVCCFSRASILSVAVRPSAVGSLLRASCTSSTAW